MTLRRGHVGPATGPATGPQTRFGKVQRADRHRPHPRRERFLSEPRDAAAVKAERGLSPSHVLHGTARSNTQNDGTSGGRKTLSFQDEFSAMFIC